MADTPKFREYVSSPKADLFVAEGDFEIPGRERGTGVGNGSPVDPTPVSSPAITTFRYSATFGELCKALCLASLEFPEITKDTENPYYGSTYADLATLIKATRPALAKHGLFIVQAPHANPKGVSVTTMLMHGSGEWLVSELELPAKANRKKKRKDDDSDDAPEVEVRPDAQALGSAITYARRYSYQAILNIAAEEDDDGNAAVGKAQWDRASSSTEGGSGTINPVQIRAIRSACETGKKTEKELINYLGGLGYEILEDLPKSKQQEVIKWALGK